MEKETYKVMVQLGGMHAGLTTLEAKKRFLEFGPNAIREKKRTSLVLQFFGQFKDLMVLILIGASIFAYFASEAVDASIIIGIVILNATIGVVQEFKAEKAVDALKKLLSPRARVMRGGKEQQIEAENLVPGDLVILHEGDSVCADAEILEENEVFLNESVLTGESVPVKKDTAKNKKIFMGTQIASGNCRAMVTATGMKTEFGKIALLTSETKKDKTPLQKELGHIGSFVGKITIGISAILFLIGIFVQHRAIVDTLLFAVSVAVAAVPEGLPTTITVALALGVQRLARKNAIVKQLSSVETLGSTTVICTDKTGTLTKNEMTVKEILINNYTIIAHGAGYAPEGSFSFHYTPSGKQDFFECEKKNMADLAYKKASLYKMFEMLCRTAALCNNARLTKEGSAWKILGDPTEGALLTAAEKAGFSAERVSEKHKKIFEIPFDSTRKCMSVISRETETGAITAYVKGAPESLLEKCCYIMEDGQILPLTEEKKAAIAQHNELFAKRALRTIGLASKELSKEVRRKYDHAEIEKNLVFLGIMAMADPPREEVKEAVKLTHHAGIRVIIVTGDHGLTAHAIAKEIGLAKSYGVHIVTGEMLNKMSDDKLAKFLAPGEETIFARVSPEHKMKIVEALKRMGEVVAVTGDGVNDAPALKRADIGIAMGIAGTDVSKEAANMVLADDSFASIVSAVIEGRTIYENMKKFIYYIFSSNIGEVLAVFGGIVIGLPAPLTAVFMLIINTLTDVFPSLALGIEPVEKNILERPPRKPSARIMEKAFVYRYLASGVFIGLITIATFIGNLIISGWKFGERIELNSALYIESSTMAFALLTLIQMVQAINSRSSTASVFKMKFFENIPLLGAIAFSVIATVALIQIPVLSHLIKAAPLSLNQWLALVGLSFFILVFEEIRKIFTRTKHRHAHSRL